VRNNGIIEVADEFSEEEEEDIFDKWKKRSPEDGITYRLPPKGIILDFIDRVKQ
jgi:hemerythrin superfamily protein